MPETPPTIIVTVDDNQSNRYAVARILRRAGFEVYEAGTGEEALALAEKNPDLMILDINLPDLDGFEICRRIKSNPETAATAVLHLSGLATDLQDRVHGLDSGADAYLTLPVEPTELLATVRALLRIRTAEEEARALASQWQQTFDAISDGVCLLDGRGFIRRCNRAAAGMLQLPSPADAEGKPFELLLQQLRAGDDLPGLSLPEELARETRQVRLGERWYRITADAIASDTGQPSGSVCILSEITERKRAAETLQARSDRLKLLSEAASVLLLGDAPENWIAELYRRVGEYLHLDIYLNYLVSPDAHSFVLASHYGLDPITAERIGVIPLGVMARSDTTSTSADGAAGAGPGLPDVELIRSFGVSAYACYPLLAHGQLMGTFSFGSRRCDRFDPDDLALVQTLCDQVAMAVDRTRLIGELKQRAEELAEADQRKDDFLAMLAHELRNPLGAINNALHILARIGSQSDQETQHRETVARQLGHLGRLVDDLLDVSRISRGKIELRREPVDVAQAVRHAVESCRSLLEERGHRLDLELPETALWVDADPTRLEQVVSNLLNNAAKYTEPGGEIRVAVRRSTLPDRSSTAAASIVVRDTGIGISPEMLRRVFDPFAQGAQALDRSAGGLGLGLTLVRNLAELHGGTVGVVSEGSGRGSEFDVRLPLSTGPVLELPLDEPKNGGRGSGERAVRHVLLVEDNEDARETMRDLLELMGYRVDTASEGRSGVLLAQELRPDAALIDIGLPGLTGYEVAQAIRGVEVGREIFLVALTGYGTPEDRDRALAAGFDRHLVKPVDPEELHRVLQAFRVAPAPPEGH
ncbi:MAG: response regulator [Armatimonadota bacterium]